MVWLDLEEFVTVRYASDYMCLVEHRHYWQGLTPPEVKGGTVSVSGVMTRDHQEAGPVLQGEGGERQEARPGLVQQLLEPQVNILPRNLYFYSIGVHFMGKITPEMQVSDNFSSPKKPYLTHFGQKSLKCDPSPSAHLEEYSPMPGGRRSAAASRCRPSG